MRKLLVKAFVERGVGEREMSERRWVEMLDWVLRACEMYSVPSIVNSPWPGHTNLGTIFWRVFKDVR